MTYPGNTPSTGILKSGTSFLGYVCGSHFLKYTNILKFKLNSNVSSPSIVECGLEKISDAGGPRGYKLVYSLGTSLLQATLQPEIWGV